MVKQKNLARILCSRSFSSEGILEASSKEVKSIVLIGTISLPNDNSNIKYFYLLICLIMEIANKIQ